MKYTEEDFLTTLRKLGLRQGGPVRLGYAEETVTGNARTQDGEPVWVRIGTLADEIVWMRPDSIEEASRELAGRVPMPRLIDALTWDVFDTEEQVDRKARAHVFERVQGRPVSPEPDVCALPAVSDRWWEELQIAERRIESAAWAGSGQSERRVRRWVEAMAGDSRFAKVPIEWKPQHCDFHWANLLSTPDLVIVDWEGYSLAPKGFDAAQLLTYSLGHRPTFERVREVFSEALSGESGMLAQLFAAADVWTAVKNGFHPHLERPLKEHVRGLLST